jgi:hypothetical protein
MGSLMVALPVAMESHDSVIDPDLPAATFMVAPTPFEDLLRRTIPTPGEQVSQQGLYSRTLMAIMTR